MNIFKDVLMTVFMFFKSLLSNKDLSSLSGRVAKRVDENYIILKQLHENLSCSVLNSLNMRFGCLKALASSENLIFH